MDGLALPRPSLRVRPMVLVLALALALPVVPQAQPTSDDGVVRFSYPDTLATQVHLAGDFNGWSQTATPLDREGAGWATRVFLDAGVYEYKFFVDGNWQLDPANPEISSQGNSVVRVGPDGGVLPPRPTSTPGATGGGAGSGANLGWSLRYLAYLTSRRDPALDRYDLERPLQDIDLRLDVRITPELSGGFVANLTNRGPGEPESQLSLRYERGGVEWTPGTSKLALFDNLLVADFDDPGALVGRIGIYADRFGFQRRGLDWRQRILGAPLEVLYADDTEPGPGPVEPALPDSLGTPAAGSQLERYTTSASQRGADVLAVRLRAGTDDQGLGLAWRLDRGGLRGGLADLGVTRASNDTVLATGDIYATSERWSAWGFDARGRWRDVRIAAEYLTGSRRAEATTVSPLDVGSTGGVVNTQRGDPLSSDSRFDLDRSRRAVVVARSTREARTPGWSARPGSGELAGPSLRYAYEEHDFSALVTGQPFLMREHTVAAGIDGKVAGIEARLELEQHWFRYPQGATWETQFWFRRQNAWLDEDVTRVDRMTMLGVRSPFIARLHADRVLWPEHDLSGELHMAYAAPAIGNAPRYFEGILRFELPLDERLTLRTHSRLAVYRQFETQDPAVVAALGPGTHFEAGDIPFSGAAPVDYSYRALSAHFVELVYAVNNRSDIVFGFGVDPYVLYDVTNEFAWIGWDQFLFDNGAAPADALAHPVDLGGRLESAERALERERRAVVEARLRF